MGGFHERLRMVYRGETRPASPVEIQRTISAASAEASCPDPKLSRVDSYLKTISEEDQLVIQTLFDAACGMSWEVVTHIYLQTNVQDRSLKNVMQVIKNILNELQNYSIAANQLKVGHITEENVLQIHTRH